MLDGSGPPVSCGCVTYDEGVLSAHGDHRAVDGPQERHHNVLDMLKGFPLRERQRDREREGERVTGRER